MPFQLSPFSDIGLDDALLLTLLSEHASSALPGLARLWSYYRNPGAAAGPGPAGGASAPRLAQAAGLPARLRTRSIAGADDRAGGAREVVIENDIAWRIHAMVDFMLGRPVAIRSLAPDESRRAEIESVLDAVFEASGGAALLHDVALLGAVYGHVDLLVRADDLFRRASSPAAPGADRARALAGAVRIEIIEAPRAVPLLDPADFRRLSAMIIRFERDADATGAAPDAATGARTSRAPGGAFSFLRSLRAGASQAFAAHGAPSASRPPTEVVEIFSARARQLYENGALVDESPNPLGVVPVAHIQNISQPFRYEGLSEVEPLIPLQDELNTRLSDRANRVTMQSFKMYLAKGLEGFGAAGGAPLAVGPGQVWSTENIGASVEAFGGDSSSPSEDNHIEQIREALDKASGVPPIAAGVIRERIGQLSSENALRITLLGLLAKIGRKQAAYGRGVAEAARLALLALDVAGVFRTSPAERAVRIDWPEPLPRAERELLEEAQMKQSLGVPRARILADLGYAPTINGVV